MIKETKSKLYSKESQNPNNIHISFSEFALYNQCPHLHLIYKHLGLATQPPSIHLFFGNAIHEAIETSVKANTSIEQTIKFFSDKFRKDMMDNMLKDKEFKNVDNFIEQGEYILRQMEVKGFLDNHDIYSAEESLFEKIYKKFFFKGFIDRITHEKNNDRYLIRDWKTSGEKWDVSKKKKDDIFLGQMRFYKYFWAKKNGIDLNKIDCEYVILNRLKDKKNSSGGFGEIQIMEVKSSEEEMMESLGKLADTVKKIHIEKVFPKIKFYGDEKNGCRFCAFKGGMHPLCNAKYNQYVELLEEYKQK